MLAKNFDLQEYFDRIGFSGAAKADVPTLIKMMRCQLFSVPFENLDVQAGKVVSLIPEEIVDKIVHRRRGGYCYEVNGLFAVALKTLGFEYDLMAARPMFYPVRRPRTHMTIIVKLNGEQWLCDTGFGSCGIRSPLPFGQIGEPVRQEHETYLLSRPNQREYLLQALVDGEWANQYGFELWPQEWVDFAPANYLNSTHPDAIFVQKLLVVLHNPNGRKMLFGDTLTIAADGKITKRIVDIADHAAILAEEFNLIRPH